jgi:hypothetical protein
LYGQFFLKKHPARKDKFSIKINVILGQHGSNELVEASGRDEAALFRNLR